MNLLRFSSPRRVIQSVCNRRRALLLCLAATAAAPVNAASEAVERCADAAAAWWNGEMGIAFEAIDPATAVPICLAATSADGTDGDAWAILARALARAQRYEEAIAASDKAVELDSAIGLWFRGVSYEYGYGIAVDQVEAAKWYRLAADLGDPLAQCNLARQYFDGRGVAVDEYEGLKWVRRSAEQGSPCGQVSLANAYVNGSGVTYDAREALKWARRAADQNDGEGQDTLGWMYEHGVGVRADAVEAVKWYRRAAEQGEASGQVSLGWMYERGSGVELDEALAVIWYRSAAEQGYSPGQAALGNMYANGRGVVKQDDVQAVHWFRLAAEQGDATGQFQLASMYEYGRGVPQDDAAAASWYRLAAAQGHADASSQLDAMIAAGRVSDGAVDDLPTAAAVGASATDTPRPAATLEPLVPPASTSARAGGKGFTQVVDPAGQVVTEYDGSYALLIGVARYTGGWPSLPSVSQEMREVGDVLINLGFTVEPIVGPEVSSAALKQAIETFVNRYGYEAKNRLLIFYSGHGHTLDEMTRGYLVPSDAPAPSLDERAFLEKAYALEDVMSWARKMRANHALFLFDSCFSGQIFLTRARPEAPPIIDRLLAEPVRQFITAGTAEEEVPAQSVFVPALIKGLEHRRADLNRDGYVLGSELGLFLQSEIGNLEIGQTPQYGKMPDYRLAQGDFVFALGDGSQ